MTAGREYTDEVRRLFAAPGHAGNLPEGPGLIHEGEAQALDRGAWVRFAARLQDGTISTARFLAWGCPHFLAACELAASRLEGCAPGAAAGIAPATLSQDLEVPAEKLGRLLVIEDALRELAAAQARSK